MIWFKDSWKTSGVTYACHVKRRERVRKATQRYAATAKGRATQKRRNDEKNPRRVHVGRAYLGTAATVDVAQAANDHARVLRAELKTRQRAEREALDSVAQTE